LLGDLPSGIVWILWSETAALGLVPEQVTAGEIDVAKGTTKKRKMTGKGNILKMGLEG
jgi:hypothetical protein